MREFEGSNELNPEVLKAEWGEDLYALIERAFTKFATEKKAFNLDFNGATVLIDGQLSPDEVVQEVKKKLGIEDEE